MSRRYTDDRGRTWTIRLDDGATVRRVADVCGVDLDGLTAAGYEELIGDRDLFADVLLCSQFDESGRRFTVGPAEFRACLDDDAVWEAAAGAFADALVADVPHFVVAAASARPRPDEGGPIPPPPPPRRPAVASGPMLVGGPRSIRAGAGGAASPWVTCVLDVSGHPGLEIPEGPVPLTGDAGRPVGQADELIVEGGKLMISGRLGGSPAAREVATAGVAGYPWSIAATIADDDGRPALRSLRVT